MKTCFKCGNTKPFADFYRHAQMADGYLGKCKECTRHDVQENRQTRRDYYLIYDRKRYDANPDRVTRNTPHTRNSQAYVNKYPERKKANTTVSNAIRDGRLIRKPCEVCGVAVGVEAHHTDYSKPLDVQWLCVKHHAVTRRKSRVL